eukprot:2063281-Rhodomonas_salina.4
MLVPPPALPVLPGSAIRDVSTGQRVADSGVATCRTGAMRSCNASERMRRARCEHGGATLDHSTTVSRVSTGHRVADQYQTWRSECVGRYLAIREAARWRESNQWLWILCPRRPT